MPSYVDHMFGRYPVSKSLFSFFHSLRMSVRTNKYFLLPSNEKKRQKYASREPLQNRHTMHSSYYGTVCTKVN